MGLNRGWQPHFYGDFLRTFNDLGYALAQSFEIKGLGQNPFKTRKNRIIGVTARHNIEDREIIQIILKHPPPSLGCLPTVLKIRNSGREEPVCPDDPQDRLTSLARSLQAPPLHLYPENPPNPR